MSPYFLFFPYWLYWQDTVSGESQKNGPRKMVPGKNGPRKNGPRKISPRKNGPRKTQNRKIVGWASSIVVCVWNVGMWSIYENPKLGNKPKTRKREVVGLASSIVARARVCVCVCGMFGCDQSMKTQNSTTNRPRLL